LSLNMPMVEVEIATTIRFKWFNGNAIRISPWNFADQIGEVVHTQD
jgi:hypothetical protein